MKIADILDLAFPQRGWSSSCASGATQQEQYDAIDWPEALSTKPTLGEILAQEAAAEAALAARPKAVAKTAFADLSPSQETFAIVDRGIALVAMDEVNLLRAWITSFKAAVAGAGTLAALKTAVAALDNLPQRQPTDIKPAIRNKIDAE